MDSSFWENRYKEGSTGWDIGKASRPIEEYIKQIHKKNLNILIPGAGNGYEAEALLKMGFESITVLDWAESPLKNLKDRLSSTGNNLRLLHENFFDHQGSYDLILEQTFFCALDPSLRKDYAQKVASLLKPEGKLVGLLFHFQNEKQGPPFGGNPAEYQFLFNQDFKIKTLEMAYNSIPPRMGKEVFINFEKKD